ASKDVYNLRLLKVWRGAGVLSYNRFEENTMSAARVSLAVSVRRLSIVASIVGCVAGATTMHGQKKGFACDKDNGGLTLPTGFCAGVIADNLGTARNLVVAPNGDIFVSVRSGPTVQGQPPQPGFILGLRDTDGDG